jgi:hypothetical protein
VFVTNSLVISYYLFVHYKVLRHNHKSSWRNNCLKQQTLWKYFLLEKTSLPKLFTAFYENWLFLVVAVRFQKWKLSWANWIQHKSSLLTRLRCIVILSSYLYLWLPKEVGPMSSLHFFQLTFSLFHTSVTSSTWSIYSLQYPDLNNCSIFSSTCLIY